MALPVAAPNSSVTRPLGKVNGVTYVLGKVGTTTFNVYKSTDPGNVSFTVAASSTVSSDMFFYDHVYDGSQFHIVAYDTVTFIVAYYRFNPATETFTQQNVTVANVSGMGAPSYNARPTIAYRSAPAGGEIVVASAGAQDFDMGTGYDRANYWRFSNTGTPSISGPFAFAGGARTVTESYPYVVKDANNDNIHCFWIANNSGASGGQGSLIEAVTLNTSNALSTRRSFSHGSTAFNVSFDRPLIAWDDGGTSKVSFVYLASGDPSNNFYYVEAVCNPSVAAPSVTLKTGSYGMSGGVSHDFFRHSGIFYFFYLKSSDSDGYYITSEDDGATWDSAGTIWVVTGAAQAAAYNFQEMDSGVFGHAYYDGSWKYHEFVIASGPPPVLLTRSDEAGSANAVSAIKTMPFLSASVVNSANLIEAFTPIVQEFTSAAEVDAGTEYTVLKGDDVEAAAESDAGDPLTVEKLAGITSAGSSDLAQLIDAEQPVVADVLAAGSADQAQAFADFKSVSVDTAAELDFSTVMTVVRQVLIQAAQGTAAANQFEAQKLIGLLSAAGVSQAQEILAEFSLAVNAAAGTDEATQFIAEAVRSFTAAIDTSSATSTDIAKLTAFDAASSSDTGNSFDVIKLQSILQANQTDLASSFTGELIVVVDAGSETANASALTAQQLRLIARTDEAGSAFTFGTSKSLALTAVLSDDLANTVSGEASAVIGAASATESAQSLLSQKAQQFAQAMALSAGMIFGVRKTQSLDPVSEIDTGNTVSGSADLVLGVASELATGALISMVKSASLLAASSASMSNLFTHARQVNLSTAQQLSTVFDLATNKRLTVQQSLDLSVANNIAKSISRNVAAALASESADDLDVQYSVTLNAAEEDSAAYNVLLFLINRTKRTTTLLIDDEAVQILVGQDAVTVLVNDERIEVVLNDGANQVAQ